MIKRICGPSYSIIYISLLINVIHACQPPIQYHSSAAYGTSQFQPDSLEQSSFIQSQSLQEELVQNEVNPNAEIESPNQWSTNSPVESVFSESTTSQSAPNAHITRPPTNPFVPIEAQPAEKSAYECSTKTISSFMDILDCTSVETYNADGATARYGSNECGFEPENLCRFYSVPDEELQFRRGIFAHHSLQQNNSQLQFNQFEDSFSSFTKRPLGAVPNKNFLVVAEPFGNTPTANAILQADIRCQVGNGELSFDYWTTIEDAVLKVCTRVGQDRRCTSNILYAVDSTNVQVQIVHPEGDTSFVVEIIATEFKHPGIFIIDNLKYEADLCEITADSDFNGHHMVERPSNAKAFSQPNFDVDGPSFSIDGKSVDNSIEPTTPPSTEITAEPTEMPNQHKINSVPSVLVDNETKGWMNGLKIQKMRESACEILSCNFNQNLCRYSQPNLQEEDPTYGKWQTANIRLDGSHKSVPGKEGFAFVGMDDRSINKKGRKVYVLESADFQLNNDSVLSFDLYRRSNAISLQICVDSLSNCLYEAPTVRSTSYWKLNETMPLPKESKKVYFVAEQLKRFKWLAVDNIKLLSNGCTV